MEILKNAARQNRIGHAYLFYGPRGTGKTTTARLLAKIVNCDTRHLDPEFKTKGEPCNTCPACLSIDSGRALDIIEIDAASNRGIDEIRNLQEGLRLAPAALRRKVFIIDESVVITGSYNPTQNGDESNDENVLIIHDALIAKSAFLKGPLGLIYSNADGLLMVVVTTPFSSVPIKTESLIIVAQVN